jgi:hypothetical protein
MEVPLKEEQPSIKMYLGMEFRNRNVFDESRAIVKAIEDEYSEATQ